MAYPASPSSKHASTEEKEAELRQQEAALVKLGELYRDQKYVLQWLQPRFLMKLTSALQQCPRYCRGHQPLARIRFIYCEGEDGEA